MANRQFLPNVVEQFRSLNRSGERLAVTEGFGRPFRDRRYTIFHTHGGKDNHFQGVQRVGNHLLISGSFPYSRKRSDLFVVRFASRPSDPGPWGSNLMRDRNPPDMDRLANYFRIDGAYWHPGGFNLLDSTAVIPIENFDHQSKIVFVDVQDPEDPRLLTDREVDRPDYKAGACAVTPLANDRILLAVWSDSDKPPPDERKSPFHLDLYRSTHPNSTKRFTLIAQFFPPEDHDFHRKFQSLDFIWGGEQGGEETLFLIGFENTSGAAPEFPGDDVAYLFEVDLNALPASAPANPLLLGDDFLGQAEPPCVFVCSKRWYNMDAGSCAYVDSNQQLIIYSVYHFIQRLRRRSILGIKCQEFRATTFASPIDRIEDAWVDLYEGPEMEGRRLTLLGPWDSSVENAKRIFADDKRFDFTASIRCQLPGDRAFVLYPEKEFRGEGALVITGNGLVREIDVPGTGYAGQFGSCRFQPRSVALALPGAIVR
jgi:hypothetical protein